MITQAAFERGAQELVGFTGDRAWNPRAGLCVRASGSSSPALKALDARTLFVDLMGVIWNDGATTITVKDNAGGTIGTILAGGVANVYCFDTSTAAGAWRLVTKAFLT